MICFTTSVTHNLFYLALLLLFGCSAVPTLEIDAVPTAETVSADVNGFQIQIDGATLDVTSSAPTIRQLLEDVGIEVGLNDEVTPPLYEPAVPGTVIAIVRVTESVETIERGIPFERRTVRNESMGAEEPPEIIQVGRNGLEELTVRIVYRDGIESDRRVTRVSLVNEPVEEIVMVGVDIVSPDETVRISGLLAFINGSGAQILRDDSSFPETLDLGGVPDRRVFRLSPNGDWLLYTLREDVDEQRFNSLWVVSTQPEAEPVALESENILWADWNPARRERPEIAWSTGIPTTLSPGWEANNDLWLVELDGSRVISQTAEQILQPYPATYGWWGGDYAWSPDGSQIGYSFANEIGVVDAERNDPGSERLQVRQTLHQFVEFDTRSDWVWIHTVVVAGRKSAGVYPPRWPRSDGRPL